MNGLMQRTTNSARAALALLGLWVGLCIPAWAHKASDAYLQLGDSVATASTASGTASVMTLKLSVALRDLDAAIETLDSDNNRSLEWGEIRRNLPVIQAWVGQGLQLQCDANTLPLNWAFESLEQRSDGVYVRMGSMASCPQGALTIGYQLMKTVDATHRLLVGGTLQGQAVASVVSPQAATSVSLRATVATGAGAVGQTGWSALAQFFPEGMHHIATGYDHLAFLLALLLPIMLRQKAPVQQAAMHSRPGLSALLRTVTGFTIGHSITLVLATLGWIASPSWVEPAIAVTIGLSALLNLYPVRWVRSDALALVFGLIHGLGFSGIMREANVSPTLLPWALAGFNLGVEAGQLVGVALWCGVHLALARWQRYDQVVVRGGSWALLLLAFYWAATRLAGG
jgi:HupE / UreJ protein